MFINAISFVMQNILLFQSLVWRHNERDGVSNHERHDCLLNRLFRHRSKKTSKLRVTDLCAGNSPVTGEFPAQRASNAENVSIWWRHHLFWQRNEQQQRGDDNSQSARALVRPSVYLNLLMWQTWSYICCFVPFQVLFQHYFHTWFTVTCHELLICAHYVIGKGQSPATTSWNIQTTVV